MPKIFTKRYPLEKGGPQRLELIYDDTFSHLIVNFDESEAGAASRGELVQGREFLLGDDSVLKVQLTGTTELMFLRNAQPLLGSRLDSEQSMKQAGGAVMALAAVDAAIALLLLIRTAKPVDWDLMGGYPFCLLRGLVFLPLGLGIRGLRSAVAAGIALVLVCLDGLFSLGLVAQAYSHWGVPVAVAAHVGAFRHCLRALRAKAA
jgi:hypothetical protein